MSFITIKWNELNGLLFSPIAILSYYTIIYIIIASIMYTMKRNYKLQVNEWNEEEHKSFLRSSIKYYVYGLILLLIEEYILNQIRKEKDTPKKSFDLEEYY